MPTLATPSAVDRSAYRPVSSARLLVGLAVAVLGAALVTPVARHAVDPLPSIPYLVVIVTAAWFGRFIAGALAVAICTVLLDVYGLASSGVRLGSADVLSLAAFVVVGMAASWLVAYEQVARARAKRVEERLAFLNEASKVLEEPLDSAVALQRLAEFVVPELADWCAVQTVDEAGRLVTVAVAHPDPDKVRHVLDLQGRRPNDGSGVADHVVRTGEPMFVRTIDDGVLRAWARDEEESELARSLGLRSAIMAPLTARGRTLGVLTLIVAEGDWKYDRDDLDFAVELATRAALSVDTLTAYERARRSSERNAILQRLTASLSKAITVDEVVSAVVREGVAEIEARAALIALVSSSGKDLIVTGEYGYSRSAVEPWNSFPLAADLPMSQAVRDRRPLVVDNLLERYPVFRGSVPSDDHTLVCLPMTVGGRVIGGISISFPEIRPMDEEDLKFLEAIAGQAGQALRRAMLYEERDRTAQTLQQSLLPRTLPTPEGVRFAARYWAAGDAAEVGGDFYDVLETRHGLLALIGDVCGRGPEAAAVMGMARYTAWGAAERESDPGRILETVNEALLRNAAGERFVTMAAVFVESFSGGLRVRAASAGHPPAMRIGRTIRPIDTGGMLLGVFDVPPIRSVTTDLPPGEMLMLYTDGVIERTGDHVPLEEDALLVRALLNVRSSDPDDVASVVERVLMAEGGLEDDAAILIVSSVPD